MVTILQEPRNAAPGLKNPSVAVGIDRNDASLAMAGEVLPHVQGESLKGSAVVRRRLLNSPTTRAFLVVATAQGREAECFSDMDRDRP